MRPEETAPHGQDGDGQGPDGGPDGGDAAPGTRAAGGASDAVLRELEALVRERDEWREKAMRARADYDNLQRRTTRDAALERDRNKARVLESFLPLAELAHMAARQAEADPGPLAEGVVLVAREFDRLLDREGVVRTGEVGEKADPARHEVLAQEPAEGVASGCVSRVVQPGYLLGDKVLRYAKVCVAP